MAPRGATRGTSGRDDVAALEVVPAKLRPPRRRTGVLERPALVARIDAAPRHVVVRAPAGYGKTTLVREWIETLDRPAAWLSLDRGDDDPVVFFRHLVAAFATLTPVPGAQAVAGRAAAWNPTAALAALGVDLADAPPAVLVIDDLHEVVNAEILDFGDRVLDALPAAIRVVIVTRGDPGARRHRRVLDGSLTEVAVDDLRLDSAGSAALLTSVAPDLDPATVALAVERCDGWAAGLALAGLALRGTDDAHRLATGLSLADRPAAEYLRAEVLNGLDSELRDFMVRSSVLDTLGAPLCDATLDREDSHEVLEALATSGNLFVVGLDDGGTSYRYHHLWRELLLAELRATDPDAEPGLRRRAAAWLEAHDRIDDAVPQWLAAGEPAAATRLIAASMNGYLLTGRVATLQRWLAEFTPAEVQADPALALAAAWIATFTGTQDEIGLALARLADWPADTVLLDGTSLRPAYAAAELVSGAGGIKASIRAAELVVEAGPESNPWWATARVIGTVSRYQAGLIDEPDAALLDAERDIGAVPTLGALVGAHRAWLRLRAGRLREAETFAAAGARTITDAGLADYPAYVAVIAVQAAVQAHAGNVDVAEEAVERSGRMLGGSAAFSDRGRTFCHLLLADARLTLDDPAAAAGDLAIASVLVDAEPDAVVLHDYADELTARFEVTTGAGLVEPLSAAELRVLRELPTHRSLREIAESLFVSRNTVKTQSIAIYRKLGVSNRSGAVERARELGLLAP